MHGETVKFTEKKFWKYVSFHSKHDDTFMLLPGSCNKVSNILLPATVLGLVLWKCDWQCVVTSSPLDNLLL